MSDRVERLVRQGLATDILFGVEVVPVRRAAAAGAHATAASTRRASADSERAALLDALRRTHDERCPHCTTATAHTRTVFGEGSPEALVMFVGEAPGADEDRTGRPFVGRAGQKLDDMIRAMGLAREDVYIANILKARPLDNRTPLPDEVAHCAPYLAEQIRIIRPAVLVALGAPAAKFLLDTDIGITRLRGQWGTYRDGDLAIDVMPTFHPAYLLRNYTVETRQRVWSDIQTVMERVGSGARGGEAPAGARGGEAPAGARGGEAPPGARSTQA